MKVSKEFSINEAKNIIRPTGYWALKRISRKWYFLKQEILKELGISSIIKFLKRYA